MQKGSTPEIGKSRVPSNASITHCEGASSLEIGKSRLNKGPGREKFFHFSKPSPVGFWVRKERTG